MVMSDFLSRQMGDKSEPQQIIAISFNIKEVLLESCQNNAKGTFIVQTRSQLKVVKAPMVKKTPNSTNKRVQEIKPIIIDDEQELPIQQKLIVQPIQMLNYLLNIHQIKPIHNQL